MLKLGVKGVQLFKFKIGLLASALFVMTLAGCSEENSESAEPTSVTTTLPTAKEALPTNTATDPPSPEPEPMFSSSPTPERVIACRAAERAFSTSPKPLVIRRNGSTNRVPSSREVIAYEEAMHAAMDLGRVEPELQEMSTYFFSRVALFRAAAGQDRKLVKEAAGIGKFISTPGEPDRSLLDLHNAPMLDQACASVGSFTTF